MSSLLHSSGRLRPGLEDEFARLVAVHGQVGEDVPGPADEDGGRHDAPVDAGEEQPQRHHGAQREKRVVVK